MKQKFLISTFFTLIFLALCTACDKSKQNTFPGYIEGKYIYISPPISGTLKKLYVKSGDAVTIDQPLFSLEKYPEEHDVEAATARVKESDLLKEKSVANYTLQKNEYERKLRLYRQGVISKDQLDIENSQYQQAKMELNAAEQNTNALLANQQKAKWTSQQKILKSPIPARVFDIYYNPGEFITNGTPVLSLLTAEQTKIIFFIPENKLSQIAINQRIKILIDGYDRTIQAHINYISDQAQYAPPIIYSDEGRQRLVYRIEGLMDQKEQAKQVHPGQPITVQVFNHKD